MPTPTIPAGNLFMNATLYTGTGSALTVTNGASGASFQPDFVWVKSRSNAENHLLSDVVRGASGGTYYRLFTDLTAAESTNSANGISSLNSNGFTVAGGANVGASGYTYVAWNWKAGGTAVTNTSGTISSQVSANTTSGFSVVTYTGTGANATVGHGLGVAPSMIIVKDRTNTDVWCVYHSSIGATKFLILNQTAAEATLSTVWNNTAPTSSVFSVGTLADTNRSANNFVAYCWAEIAGFSKCGSYTGNGSADGPFVYTNFQPRFVMIKRSDAGAVNWYIFDTARDTYNAAGLELYPNLSNAEADGRPDLDILSNGFKIRSTSGGQNTSGGTYVYACFASNPFKYSNAR